MPSFLRRMVKGEPLKIFGNDYPTKDGTCVRDYVDVNDLADAHLLAIKKLLDPTTKKLGEAINIGSGEGMSNAEILGGLKKVFEAGNPGKKVDAGIGPRRAGDPALLTANNKKAQSFLNWKPLRTLAQSLQSAYNWESRGRVYQAEPAKPDDPLELSA